MALRNAMIYCFLSSAEYVLTDGFRDHGVRYPLLIFADGTDLEEAIIRADRELRNLGWAELEIERSKRFTGPDPDPASSDPVDQALMDAMRSGFGIVIYTDRI